MLARFIFAPTTIAVLALTASTFAEEKTEAVPLKKFRAAPAMTPEPTPAAETKPAAEPKPAEAAQPAPAQPATAPMATAPATPAEGEPQAARAVLVSKREIVAQLQIFLDQQLFSPGMIDGKQGKTLTRLFKRWQRSRGLPETGVIDENVP